MTQLHRPMIREVSVTVRDAGRVRPLVVGLTDYGFELRQKGSRQRYFLPYALAWLRAAELAAAARREARKAAYKTRKHPHLDVGN